MKKFLALLFCLFRLGAHAAEKPNIIILLTDDQRADTIHALGNPQIITPNLDRLAGPSFVFECAYNFGGNTVAVCIPARNMPATGNTYFRFDDGAWDKGQRATLPKTMKAAGYETWYREKSGISNLHHIREQFDHFEDIKTEQLRLGDKLPLVSKNPKPADFVAPTGKLPTPYPSGGLAPGVAPEPNRPKQADVTGADEMLNSKHGRYQIIHPLQPESAKRMEWFKEAKFGMFVHWGIYSTRGGIAPDGKPQQHGYTEWYQKANHLNHADYAKLAGGFNPQHYDAEQWVLTAQQAGMRYITFTAKHHDGFAMFDSACSTYDVVDATPYGRDVLKALREACDKHGMKLCLYYSHCQDWEQWNAWQTDDWIYPEKKGQAVDHEAYLSGKALPQIGELCRRYRPDGFWFDTPWFNAQKFDREVSRRVSETVRKFAPDALVNSRVAHGSDNSILHADLFDYITLGDQEIPGSKLPLYAESPDSITVSYGYDIRPGVKYRSAPDLLRRMIRTVAGGGNYLLNVGPTGDGEIPAQAVAEMKRIGTWMDQHGESIYGTSANPLGAPQPWGCSTARDGKIYLFPINYKGGTLEIKGLKQAPKNLTRHGDAASIPFTRTFDGIMLDFPANAPDEMPVVLVLEP